MSDKPAEKLKLVDAAASSDPYDLEQLRVDPSTMEGTHVKKLLTTVPVRKPNKQEFVRVHPGVQYRETQAFIELKDDRETFAVDLRAVPELREECFFATLYTTITRGGVLFLWPVKVPSADGKILEWHSSAAMAAQHAMKAWVRVRANVALGAYEISESTSPNLPEPGFPEETPFRDLYRIAFNNTKIIRSLDHPVVRRLRGGE
ncbi:hypothetical protein [Bradyrhizobium sp. I1.7.5]|uniref:hypothetical protein n=1 Tax=Bradyrhizobium sp. I1.7.5 TaxID=3156363 RepID=UPI0033994A16